MGQVLGTNIQNGCYLFLLYSYGELHMQKVLLNILTMSRKEKCTVTYFSV